MIAAIAAICNERDIIEMSVRHVLAEGIDHIYMSVGPCTDGTAEVVEGLSKETGQMSVKHDADPVFRQANVMNGLAGWAAAEGAEWIVPFDADEFPYALDGSTIADVLQESPHNKFFMRMYRHHSWNDREVAFKPHPKVIYRWSPDARLVMGQHDVSIVDAAYDVFALREWQYMNFESFVAKRDLWLRSIDSADKAAGEVIHYTRLEGYDENRMQAEWDAMMAIETVFDPIPTHMELT